MESLSPRALNALGIRWNEPTFEVCMNPARSLLIYDVESDHWVGQSFATVES